MIERVKEMLMHHEGVRLKPYRCTAGKLTIGIGHNLDDKGITLEQAMLLLDDDVRKCRSQLEQNLSWFSQLDKVRQDVLVDMCFNLGISGLMKFKNMLSAMKYGEWERAAVEALDSQWAVQVGKRADDLAKMIRTGVY